MPDNPDLAVKQLRQFHASGISLIEISDDPSTRIWEVINNLDFRVYGDIGISYPVAETFTRRDSALIQLVESKASAYLSQPSVVGIGLFKYGAVTRKEFKASVQPFIEQLEKAGKPIYFTSSRRLPADAVPSNFYIYRVNITTQNLNSLHLPADAQIGGYRFAPSKNIIGYLSPFKKFLEALSPASPKPVFINSKWLLGTLQKHPQFKSALNSLATDSNPTFPVPNESLPTPEKSAIPVIILFLVWGIAALHYNTSPLYRKSLFRYFGAHKFFIDDIFHRQIRSPLPALLLILQNAFLIGACTFTTFSTLWSTTGRNALFHYFPIFKAFGSNILSISVWSLIVSIIFSFICILWLYLSHKKSNSFTQTATIYAWPLHLNFVTGTIAVATYSAGGNTTIITVFSAITLVIFLMSFIFGSTDIARFKASRPLLYLLGTTGLYIFLIGVGFAWLMTYDSWSQIISLSLSLT
ncbi:MAG TPA: hypothetical protein VJ964_07140 [Balneolaceae bacterium]|nr:hypothetical protein [Balneolaceae bacterium]